MISFLLPLVFKNLGWNTVILKISIVLVGSLSDLGGVASSVKRWCFLHVGLLPSGNGELGLVKVCMTDAALQKLENTVLSLFKKDCVILAGLTWKDLFPEGH